MKYRESGMPEESMWKTFFEPTEILTEMEVDQNVNLLLDIGCGYGTFLIPAARMVRDSVIGVDIDEEMLGMCKRNIRANKLKNVELLLGDASSEQTFKELQLYMGEIDYICLFNILHCEEPVELLKTVNHLLSLDGKVGVIHWKYEKTPRGPSMDIRPTQSDIEQWASEVGFHLKKQVDLPPHHYGMIFKK